MEKSFDCLFLAGGNTFITVGLIYLVIGFFSIPIVIICGLISLVGASLLAISD